MEQETQTNERHWKNSNFFSFFCFSFSKTKHNLYHNIWKKLKTLQNISFVYIYLYIFYLYLYHLSGFFFFFGIFVFQPAAVGVWVGGLGPGRSPQRHRHGSSCWCQLLNTPWMWSRRLEAHTETVCSLVPRPPPQKQTARGPGCGMFQPLRVRLPVEHPPLPPSPSPRLLRQLPGFAGVRVCVCAPSLPRGV